MFVMLSFKELLEELEYLNKEYFYQDIQERDRGDDDPVTGVMGLLDDAVVVCLPEYQWLLG